MAVENVTSYLGAEGVDDSLAESDAAVLEVMPEPEAQQALDLSAQTEMLRTQINRTRRMRKDPQDATTPFGPVEAISLNLAGMGSVVAGTFALLGELTSSTLASNPLVAAITMGLPVGVAFYWGHIRNLTHEQSNPVQMPDGYGLQSFYEKRQPTDTPGVGEREVAVAILPRRHKTDEAETTIQARQRLRDAIFVAHTAGADKVIIPAAIVSKSRFGASSNAMLGRVLQQASERELVVPSGEKPCLVIDAVSARQIAEQLEIAETPWSMVLDALRRRYPNSQRLQQFDGEPTELVPLLHGYVWQAAHQELPGAISRLFRTESRTDFIRLREQLTTEVLPAGDEFNPTVHQYVPGNYGVGSEQKLAHLIARGRSLEQVAADISGRLAKNERLDDFELLYLALQTIKFEQLNIDLDLSEAKKHVGATPEIVELRNYKERKFKHKYLARLAARMALVGALAAPFAAYVHDLGGYLNFPTGDVGNSDTSGGYGELNSGNANPDTTMGWANLGKGAAQPEWKVTGFGENTDGYYTQMLANELMSYRGDTFWSDNIDARVISLPESLPDSNVPHITVEHWGDNGEGNYSLPVKYGTRIASIRVHDVSYKPVPFKLYEGYDGTYSVDLTSSYSSQDGIYISYDLVKSLQPIVKATQPIRIDDSVAFQPDRVPLDLRNPASIGPAWVAGYTHYNYRYVNAPVLDKLVGQDSADAIASAVDHAKECNCNVCAATEAISLAAVHSKDPAAIAFGYYHSGGNFITPTEGHAFLMSGDRITDGTPSGSLNVPKASQAQLEAAWQKLSRSAPVVPPHFPDPKVPLAVAGALGLGALESRKRYTARTWRWRSQLLGGLAATRHLSPVDSYMLLEWAVYGKWAEKDGPENLQRVPESPQPRFWGTPSPATPADLDWRNIPTGTLRRAAKEGIPGAQLTRGQRRSVQKTAAFVLRNKHGIRV